MNLARIRKIVNENKDELRYSYIYDILVNEENLPQEIVDDDLKMRYLINLVENTYLNSEKPFDLAFICGVAKDYSEELISNKLDLDFETLCEESLIEAYR